MNSTPKRTVSGLFSTYVELVGMGKYFWVAIAANQYGEDLCIGRDDDAPEFGVFPQDPNRIGYRGFKAQTLIYC